MEAHRTQVLAINDFGSIWTWRPMDPNNEKCCTWTWLDDPCRAGLMHIEKSPKKNWNLAPLKKHAKGPTPMWIHYFKGALSICRVRIESDGANPCKPQDRCQRSNRPPYAQRKTHVCDQSPAQRSVSWGPLSIYRVYRVRILWKWMLCGSCFPQGFHSHSTPTNVSI